MKKVLTIAMALIPFVTMGNIEKQFSTNNLKTEIMKNEENVAIKKLLFNYRDALNESNTEKAISLYSINGVFMPSSAPTAIGTNQLKEAYDFVFKNIQLSIEFYIDEIEVAGDYAFVRTTSKGTTLIHATGETVPEENRELFVLKKINDEWKIDRYMFNKMK